MLATQTSPPSLANCVHCGAGRTPDAEFCGSCGRALPRPRQEPRFIVNNELATTSVGQNLQAGELAKHCRMAAGALLFVGVVQAIGAAAIGAMAMEETGPIVLVVLSMIAGLFFAMGFWARRQPLPASICGLAVFVSLHTLDAMFDPTALARGVFMKIIVIALLAKGISAGLKHRELMRCKDALGE